MVRAVWDDYETAPIDDRLRAALAFIVKLTLQPDQLEPTDIARLRRAGISDGASEDLIEVCCAFNIIARIADTLEFEVPSWEQFQRGAKMMLKRGYR